MNQLVINKKHQAVTTSLQIAENFEKRHDHLLRDIESLKKDVPNFGEMFLESNIADSYSRNRRAYYMNRDGFTLLAMGFTGKKALKFKLKYIDAFNAMEKTLKQMPVKKLNPVLQAELAVTRTKTARANALYHIAMATESESSKQSLLANAAKELTGEMSIPILKKKEYSATEIGKKLGITANKVGRICNALDLKAEQPGQNEFGRWSNSKSRYSDKETPQWLYFEKGLKQISENV